MRTKNACDAYDKQVKVWKPSNTDMRNDKIKKPLEEFNDYVIALDREGRIALSNYISENTTEPLYQQWLGRAEIIKPSLVPLNTWSEDNEKLKELTIENCIAMLDEVL